MPTIVFPGLALAATATPAPTQTAVQGDPLPPAAPVEQHAALPRSGSGGLLQSRTALFSGPLAVVLAMIALGFGCVLLGKRESAKNRQPRR